MTGLWCPLCGDASSARPARADVVGAWGMNPLCFWRRCSYRLWPWAAVRRGGPASVPSLRALLGAHRWHPAKCPSWIWSVLRRGARLLRWPARHPGARAVVSPSRGLPMATGVRPSVVRVTYRPPLRWIPTRAADDGRAGRADRGEGESSMTVLDDIIAGVREDLAVREAATPLAVVKEQADRRTSALDCLNRLRAEDAVRVIAEVKRSSPSKGALATIKDPAALAAEYEKGGAARHLGAHGGASLPRLAGRPGRRARPRRHPRAPQGLRRHAVPGLGGAGARRGPRPADRRRPRADGARVAGRARALPRA